MEKTVGALEVRRNFGKVLQDVNDRGEKYIVERHGEPIAVVVPLEVYEQWKRSRERFFTELERAQASANLTAEEADDLAKEAVEYARRQK